MFHNLPRILFYIFITMLVALFAFTTFSHTHYQRSAMATIVEFILMITKSDTTEQEQTTALKEKSLETEIKYELEIVLNSTVKEMDFDDMQVFTVNESEDAPIVIYLHGGGYVDKITNYHWKLIDTVSQLSRVRRKLCK